MGIQAFDADGKELPPRARRIRSLTSFSAFGKGTTSACAENTVRFAQGHSVKGNYLRVRGEYAIATIIEKQPWELPPRARRIPAIGRDGGS